MANGIDILVQDRINESIATKLKNIGTQAENSARKVEKLVAALATLDSKGGALGKIAQGAFGGTGGTRKAPSRRVEPANVTAAKQLEKQRKEIAAVFEKSLSDREAYAAKQAALVAKEQAAQQKQSDKLSSIAQKQADKLAATQAAAAAKAQQAREQAAARTVAQINKATSNVGNINYDKMFGLDSGRLTQTARKAQQSMYDNLFGAHNLTTTPLTNNVAKVVNDTLIRATSSATTRKAQQQMYDNLFGAKPTVNLANVINQMQGIGQQRPNAASRSAQQQMYNNLFGGASSSNTASGSATATNAATAAVNRYTTSTRGAIQGTQQLSGAMQHLQTSTSFLRSDGLRWAKVMWSLAGATLTAGAIVDSADAYTRLQNRLSVVADSQATVNKLTEEMLQISVAARQPIEQVAKSFARFDLATRQLGMSQADTLVITENVSKALKLGGATAGEAASALLQLSQAFNKGKLDGDEFRSVMENSPVLADALAKKLGVARGELLKLAPQGKITLKVMSEAILEATDDINKAFAKLRPTIAESFTVLRSRAIVFFGELDKQLGVTSAMAGAIDVLSRNLDVLTFAVLAVTPALAIFVGSKMLSGMATLIAFAGRSAIAIGAIRSPITLVAASLANMARTAAASGSVMNAVFTNATTRAVALRFAVVGAAAGVLALGNAAARAGGMLLAAFSFGNILLLIGTLVAATIAFGDQMIVSAEKGTTMRDVTIAALQEIGDFAADVFSTVYDNVAEYFGLSTKEGQTMSEKVGQSLLAIGAAAAAVVDAILTLFNGLGKGIKSVVYFLGDAVYNSVVFVANAITSLINGAIDGINTLGSIANSILNVTGASSLIGTFGKLGNIAAIEYKSQFVDSLGDFELSTSAMSAYEEFANRVTERADARAAERNKKAADLAAKREKTIKDATDGDKKKKKGRTDEEKRADIIAKVVRAEQAAIKTAQLLGDEREQVSVITDLNNKLEEKHYKTLSEAEAAHIRDLVAQRLQAERVGEAMNTIYDNSVTKLMQDRTAALAAVNNMLASGLIDQDHATNLIKQAGNAFKEATDPTFEYSKSLDRARAVFGKFGVEAEIAGNLYDKAQQLISEGKPPMTPEQSKAIIDATKATYEYTKAQEALNSIWDESGGAIESVQRNIGALTAAYKAGWVSIDEYHKKSAGLLAQMGGLNEQTYGITDPTEPLRRGMFQLVADMPSMGQAMADAIQNTLGTAIDSLSGSITTMLTDFSSYADTVANALERPVSTLDVIRYALSDIVKQIGVDLIQATIKMGIQWAIQSAMRSTLAKAEQAQAAAMQTAMLGTNAAVATALTQIWSVPATLASIATNGEAAATGTASVAAAMTTAKSMALLGDIPAFADGSGVIKGAGNSRSDSILARLSSGEMVMSAQTVRENYPALTAIQRGDYTSGGGGIHNETNVWITYSDGTTTADTSSNNKQFANDLRNFVDSRFQQLQRERKQQGHEGYSYGG